ncbi:MAG: hypothetical protein ACI9D0_001738 [Bacteroidia bacterium]|jgi:hypothetical protein
MLGGQEGRIRGPHPYPPRMLKEGSVSRWPFSGRAAKQLPELLGI